MSEIKANYCQFPFKIILASGSPRRKELLKNLGLTFEVKATQVDEEFPLELTAEKIPLYLAEKKAKAYKFERNDEVVITSDTIVWLDGNVMNKPLDYNEAKNMLIKLSGKKHQVYTAVCINSKLKKILFYDKTDVYFKSLSLGEIDYYINNFPVYDKAGSYGVQDWLGLIGIEKIEGCFYNVMGLPIKKVYEHLINF
jgi:septum formation protein